MLKKSLNRLKFTISESNKPSIVDIEAFNEISQHLQKTESKTLQDNMLFAKLYAFVLSELTRHYNNVDAANKELNTILSEPMSVRVEMLTMALKTMEIKNLFFENGFKDPFLKTEQLHSLERLKKTYLPEILDQWDNDNVISHLTSNINLSIQNFKNDV